MRILITGSRDWTNKVVVANSIRQAWIDAGKPYRVTIIHGGARGADYIADAFAKRMHFGTEKHEANWEEFGKKAGYIRNQNMVDLGADICLAFIRNESRGATMCADLAEKAGIPVKIWRQDDYS
jgi:hypothetical protein